MLKLLLRQSIGKLDDGEVWKYDIENAAGYPTMVTEKYVQENLKNKGFVKYVYNNARLMADTTTISNENLKQDTSNIFHHVHASDIAYAVIQRINSKMVWKAE